MKDLFISHVNTDSEIAIQIAEALEAAGYSTWYYERDSVSGPSYLLQTRAGIVDSQAMVIIISHQSIGSSQVGKEVVRAHESNKPIIPLLHGGITDAEYKRRQPEWEEAIGAATSLALPNTNLQVFMARVIRGLQMLGVQPSGQAPVMDKTIAAAGVTGKFSDNKPDTPTVTKALNNEASQGLHSGHTEYVNSAEFSPNGQRIVTASVDKTAIVWDAATGKPLLKLAGHNSEVTLAKYSPDGSNIVTAHNDGTVKFWDAETGERLFNLKWHRRGITVVQFSPDNKTMITTSEDKTASIWDAITYKFMHVLGGHMDGIKSAQYSPDGKKIVTGSYDEDGDEIIRRTFNIWDVETGKLLFDKGGFDMPVAAQFLPDQDWARISILLVDGNISHWDANTGKRIYNLDLDDSTISSGSKWNVVLPDTITTCWVKSAHFSPDSKKIVTTASKDQTAKIWDAKTGRLLHNMPGHPDEVTLTEYSPDGKRIITASEHIGQIWDTETGALITRIIQNPSYGLEFRFAQFSPDGEKIVIAASDKNSEILDVKTGRVLCRLTGPVL